MAEKTQIIFEIGGFCCLCLKAVKCSTRRNEPEVIQINDDSDVEEVSSSSEHGGDSEPVSFQGICRYLELDLNQVFRGHVPANSLPSLEDSDLKGNLCFGCARASRQFSTLFRQLEEVQEKLDVCLKSVHGKVKGNTEELLLLRTSLAREPQALASFEIVERLQQQISQKCDRMFNAGVRPASPVAANVNEGQEIVDISSSSDSEDEDEEGDESETSVSVQSPPPLPVQQEVNESEEEFQEPCPDNSHCTVCNTCSSTFPTSIVIERQQKTLSLFKRNLHCPNCCRPFHRSRLWYMKRHIKICPIRVCETCNNSNEKLVFKCGVCPKGFTDKDSLVRHQNSSHKGRKWKSFSCNACKKGIDYGVILERQRNNTKIMQVMQDPSAQCPNCCRRFTHLSEFGKHWKSCSVFVCSTSCRRSTPKKRRRGGGGLPVVVNCAACNERFQSGEDMLRHLSDVHGAVRVRCRYCSRAFAHESVLRKHVLYYCTNFRSIRNKLKKPKVSRQNNDSDPLMMVNMEPRGEDAPDNQANCDGNDDGNEAIVEQVLDVKYYDES